MSVNRKGSHTQREINLPLQMPSSHSKTKTLIPLSSSRPATVKKSKSVVFCTIPTTPSAVATPLTQPRTRKKASRRTSRENYNSLNLNTIDTSPINVVTPLSQQNQMQNRECFACCDTAKLLRQVLNQVEPVSHSQTAASVLISKIDFHIRELLKKDKDVEKARA